MTGRNRTTLGGRVEMANTERQTEKMEPKLELALSGGGFRATLFHLGVIAALRDCGALPYVGRIASVSGGSIMAAHLVLNWDRYCSPRPAEFKKAALELIRFSRRDVRGRILRRWLGGTPIRLFLRLLQLLRLNLLNRRLANRIQKGIDDRTPIGLLRCHLDKFFGHAPLKDLGSRNGKPELSVLATNLNTRRLASFDRGGFREHLQAAPVLPDILSVGFGVTASAAFPGFFPPEVYDPQQFGLDGEVTYLSDAGIYDNLGVDFFFETNGEQSRQRYLLVSDASSSSNPTRNKQIKTALFTSIRAVDILMDRSKELSERLLDLSNCAVIRISDEVGEEVPTAVSPGLQGTVGKLRTDLDGFNWIEVEALVRHGYAVFRKRICEDERARALGVDEDSFSDDLSWLGSNRLTQPRKPRAIVNRLTAGASRKYVFTSSFFKDPWTYAYGVFYGFLFKEAADLIAVFSHPEQNAPLAQFATNLMGELESLQSWVLWGWQQASDLVRQLV